MICCAFCLLALHGHSQEVKTDLQLTSEQYLIKGKNQNTTAWVLFGLGTTAIVGGIAVSTGSQDDVSRALNTAFVGAPLMLLGLTLDVISIPVFVSASKNKRRAMEATTSLKFEDVPSWNGVSSYRSSVPALSVRVIF